MCVHVWAWWACLDKVQIAERKAASDARRRRRRRRRCDRANGERAVRPHKLGAVPLFEGSLAPLCVRIRSCAACLQCKAGLQPCGCVDDGAHDRPPRCALLRHAHAAHGAQTTAPFLNACFPRMRADLIDKQTITSSHSWIAKESRTPQQQQQWLGRSAAARPLQQLQGGPAPAPAAAAREWPCHRGQAPANAVALALAHQELRRAGAWCRGGSSSSSSIAVSMRGQGFSFPLVSLPRSPVDGPPLARAIGSHMQRDASSDRASLHAGSAGPCGPVDGHTPNATA